MSNIDQSIQNKCKTKTKFVQQQANIYPKDLRNSEETVAESEK